jgi:surfactin synthase thioesterase subunit
MSAELNLYCIAYAGGSAAATYSRWARLLPPNIKVIPLELPGRGRRMPEPFVASVDAAVEEFFNSIADEIRDTPYALYGHSMGTTLCYELCKLISNQGLPAPKALFLSGRNPPHYAYPQRNLHLLDDDSFLEEIRQLGGTPDEFFKMKSLMMTFVPILRNDYRIIELYRHSQPIHVTSADIVFFRSDQDALVQSHASYEWQRYTRGNFVVYDFVGGHFFINEQAQGICQEISRALAPYLQSAGRTPYASFA